MSGSTTISSPVQLSRDRPRRAPRIDRFRHPWLLVSLGVVVLAAAFVAGTGMRPEYDAYGWLVWGRQAIHLNLNTNAAPSWKPLTFLFTFPYALAGRGAMWLWMVTAVAGAFGGAIFAGRIAYRLVPAQSGRGYARILAAGLAAAGILGIVGYWHLVLIAASDPMDITLCLGAVDCHLSGRPRAAWVLLVLLTLGRPEAGTLTLLYAAWAWRTHPETRRWLVSGLVVIPVLWFGIPALTSRSWFISSDVAIESTKGIPGNKLARVPHNFLSLYELPMQLAVLFGIVVALIRRDRRWLLLAGCSVVWLITWTAFAAHGWNAAARYLFEPAALLIVLAAAAMGWLMSIAPRNTLLRWAAVLPLMALAVALAPHARVRARLVHNEIVYSHVWSRQIDRLHKLVAVEGRRRILSCGQPVTNIAFQSILAYEIGKNVADIGWDPPSSIKSGKPIVLFEPQRVGFVVRPIHTRRPGCQGLATHTAFGWLRRAATRVG